MIQQRVVLFLLFFFIAIIPGKSQLIDSLFVRWNKATTISLERQIASSTDSLKRVRYENRLSVFNGYLNIKSLSDINTQSVRYSFLQHLVKTGSRRKLSRFYIVEANQSGSKFVLRNFLIYFTSANGAQIEMFLKVGQKWIKESQCQIDNFKIESLRNYIAQGWKGFNNDDVIVTKFLNKKVQESEYFLYNTLSETGVIKEIFQCDKFTKY